MILITIICCVCLTNPLYGSLRTEDQLGHLEASVNEASSAQQRSRALIELALSSYRLTGDTRSSMDYLLEASRAGMASSSALFAASLLSSSEELPLLSFWYAHLALSLPDDSGLPASGLSTLAERAGHVCLTYPDCIPLVLSTGILQAIDSELRKAPQAEKLPLQGLTLALAANDQKMSLAAWKGIYSFREQEELPEKLQDSYRALSTALEKEDREYIYTSLVEQGLFMPALVYGVSSGLDTKRTEAILEYFQRYERIVTAFYRAQGVGRADSAATRKRLSLSEHTLMRSLGLPYRGEDSSESIDRVTHSARFVGTTNSDNGYSFFLGRFRRAEEVHIDQYGLEVELTYYRLEEVLLPSFSGWFSSQVDVGGWSENERIYHVVPAYMNKPASAFSVLTTPGSIDQALSIAEKLLASGDSALEFQGASVLLSLASAQDIFAGTFMPGSSQQEQLLRFSREFLSLIEESAILAHEGRHSIEQLHQSELFASSSSYERELRAKFSELSFCRDPRIPLAIMFNDTSPSSAHGRANREIGRILSSYLVSSGLAEDTTSALRLLPEIPPEVIRQAIREADPLAGPERTTD